jgi:acetylornithine deacetylase
VVFLQELTMRADAEYCRETLAGLVRINSINPAFTGGTTDERHVAEFVSARLDALGAVVTRHEPAPRRVSVTGRVAGAGGGRSLMLYGHYDTVGVEGMEHPFGAEVREGRLYGRGAYDMKGGLAACLAAVRLLQNAGIRLRGDVVVCAVADEETESLGMRDVLTRVRTDGAVVTEPTELDVCVAHKGFTWIAVDTEGRAAHGSRFDLGLDANLRMGRFLAALETLERDVRARTPHALLGPPSLHVGTLAGGSAPSVYAAHARAEIERRMVPEETEAGVTAEIRALVDSLAAEDASFRATVTSYLTRPAFEVPAAAPIVQAILSASRSVLGHAPRVVGQSPWMDASLLAEAGVETVVLGPAGTGAHADVEWVDLASVERTAEVLAHTAAAYCGTVS